MSQIVSIKEENLSSKVVKSGTWLFLFQIFDNILAILRLVVLARLLTPSDFGVIGIATLVVQILNTFTQTGIQAVLIQNKNSDKYLNVAWTYSIFRGLFLYIILFIAAPYLGSFFNNTSTVNIIRCIGLSILFEGLTNVGILYFQKNLTFKKHFWYQIIGNLTDFIVAVTAAFIFRSVWAVVAGYVANSFIRLVLSYILSSYRPKFEWNFKSIREMNSYGKWIFGSTILTFLFTQGDDLLVGRVLGTTALGFYQLAYRISNMPATQITFIISSVMFPAYSLIQSNRLKISSAYLSTFQVTAFLSFFLGSLIFAFSYDFIALFLGRRWLPIELALQVLTIWGLMRSIGATTGALWQAVGTPGKVTKIQLLQTVILAIIIYPLTVNYGFIGTAIAVVTSAFISNSVALYQISKTIEIKLTTLLVEIFYPLLCGVIMCTSYYFIRQGFSPDTRFISFVTLAVLSILIYLGSSVILGKYFGYSVYNNIFKLVENLPALQKYTHWFDKVRRIIT